MSIVQAHMVMKISVKVRFLVLIVVALIQHQALTVLLTSVGNIESLAKQRPAPERRYVSSTTPSYFATSAL